MSVLTLKVSFRIFQMGRSKNWRVCILSFPKADPPAMSEERTWVPRLLPEPVLKAGF